MKAVVCDKPGKLIVREVRRPVRKDGEVLLKVHRVGICGTDYHIYAGKHPFLEYPRIMGHEFSASVQEIGDFSEFAVGEKVLVNPYLSCGKCSACQAGRANCCSNIQVLGVHTDGALCEYVSVPEKALYSIDGLSLSQAAMVEFLAIGAHAVRRADVKKEQSILVVGIGPIGLGAALLAKQAGAKVTVLDANQSRVEKARSIYGLKDAYIVSDDIRDVLAKETAGTFFDVVFDATGNRQAIEAGFEYVGHAGRYVLISVVDDEITFFDPHFHKKEATLLGSRNATKADFDTVVNAIRQGVIETEKLFTHHCTLEELPEKLPQWAHMQNEVVKAIVVVNP